jgi:hypothetical protein
VPADRIVAVGLLTKRDLDVLGPAFTYAWPIEDASCFSDLLAAIDEADGNPEQVREPPLGSPKSGSQA